MKPKDFLLQMMLLSQVSSNVPPAGEETVMGPAMGPAAGEEAALGPSAEEEAALGPSLGTSAEEEETLALLQLGLAQALARSPLPRHHQFGDDLLLTEGTHSGQPARQPGIPHSSQPGIPGRQGSSEDPSQEAGHEAHHLLPVQPYFRPNVATSKYGSQWLPVFSPSVRMA